MHQETDHTLVRIGFVGAGWMGRALLKRLADHPSAKVVALHQRDEGRAMEPLAAVGLRDTEFVADYGQLLDRSDVDAVFLCNPKAHHGPQSITALKAGKHVFCEKPSAIELDDHLRQVDLAAARPELVTFVDYILLFDTFEQWVRDMVAAGEFGAVTQLQVNYRHGVNIDGDKAWKLKREVMGDAIGMGIIHAVSCVVFLMHPQTRPVNVFATAMPAQVRPFEPDPIWNIVIGFDNGATGVMLGDIDSGDGYDAYHNLKGTAGGLVFDSQLERPSKVRMWRRGVHSDRW